VGNAGGVSCWFADPEGSDGFCAFVHDGLLVHHIRHLFFIVHDFNICSLFLIQLGWLLFVKICLETGIELARAA
jgi:hypothetical protein